MLYYLDEQSRPVEVEAVARQIRAWEADKPVEAVTDEECDRVITDLYHTHLPRLADEGLIDYDQRTLTIRSWEYHDLLSTILHFIRDIEDEWHL